MFYESMKSIGVEACKRIGMTDKAETEKKVVEAVKLAGKKVEFWN